MFSLTPNRPLLAVLVRLLLFPLICQKLWTKSDKNVCSLNYPPAEIIFPFVPLSPVSFGANKSISAVVGGHCSTPKSINGGVHQWSVQSLMILFNIHQWSFQKQVSLALLCCSTLHLSTLFNMRLILQEHSFRLDARRHLTSDFTSISKESKRNLVNFNSSIFFLLIY